MIEQIRPAGLDDWLARVQRNGQPALLLDVREPSEWQLASVKPGPGYELLQLPMGNIPAQLHQLDPSRPTACLCHAGVRSQHIARLLEANGFSRLANIAGGIDAWSLERDPSVPRY